MALDFSRFGTPVEQAPVLDFSSFGTPVEAEKPKPVAPRPEDQGILRQAADLPIGLGKGFVTGIRLLSDVFGADNPASQALRGAEDYLAKLMSAQAQNDQAEINRIIKESEDKGALEQVKAGLQALTIAPVDTITNVLGTAGPVIVGTLGAKLLGAGALISTGVGAITGAAMGAGTIKGTIYEATKEALLQAGASPREAEAKAVLAQEYGGENLDQILLGTVLGAGAAVGPLEQGAARLLSTKIMRDVAEKEAVKAATKSALSRRVGAGFAEAVPEAAQAFQEKTAENIALQREGFDVPTFRGATAAATFEGLAGFGPGAVLGGGRPEAPPAPIPPAAPPAPAPAPAIDVNSPAFKKKLERYETTVKRIEELEALGDQIDSQKKGQLTTARRRAAALKAEIESALGQAPGGEQDVEGTEPAATGEGFEISEFAAEAGPPPGAGAPPPSGVAAAGEPAGAATTGAPGEPAALTPAPAPAPAPTPTTAPAPQGLAPAIAPPIAPPISEPIAVPAEPAPPVSVRGLALQDQRDAGWNTEWPFIPADLTNPDFRQLIIDDPGLTLQEKQQIFESGKKLGVVPQSEQVTPLPPPPPPPPALAPPPVSITPTITTATKSAVAADLDFLDSLEDDGTLKSAGRTRRTNAQIEIDNQLDEIGQRYGLTRNDGESTNDFKVRLRNAVTFAKNYVEQGKVEEAPLQEVAKQELKKPTGYVPPEEQRVLYEETAEAFNAGVDEEAKRIYDETYQDALDDGATEKEARNQAEVAISGLQDTKLPKYKQLAENDTARRIYFQENIQQNTQSEHDQAALALSDYLAKTRRVESEKQNVPARNSYERERKTASSKRSLAYNFPVWEELSDASRKLYIDVNKTNSAKEVDTALRMVKEQIRKEKLEEQTEQAKTEAGNLAAIQYRQAVSAAIKRQPTGKGAALTEEVMDNLLKGNLGAVLDTLSRSASGLKGRKAEEFFPVKGPKGEFQLRKKGVFVRDSVARQVFQGLAATLSSIPNFKVNVVIDDNMVGVDTLGEYDAKTNTIYLSKNGLDESTLLHELVHAATVKIINQYFADKSKLTPHAIEAVEQLQRVAAAAKKRLGNKHPNAFENLYEFVAYAMTDLDFQNDLANTQIAGVAKATKEAEALPAEVQEEREMFVSPPPYMNTLWDYFTNTLAYLYKVFTPKSRTTEILMPTELSRVTTKSAEQIQRETERRKDREAKKAEKSEIEDIDTEEVSDEIKIKAQKGELVTKYGVTNLRKAILREPGMRGNLLLEASAAFQDILAAPEGGIERLAGKEGIDSRLQAKAPPKQAPAAPAQKTDAEVEAEITAQLSPRERGAKAFLKRMLSGQAYEWTVQKFQNQQRVLKQIFERAEKLQIVKYVGDDLNDVQGQITRSTGMAVDLYSRYMKPLTDRVHAGIEAYAKKKGIPLSEALARLHAVFEVRHEPERRHVKYLLKVPLDNTTQYTVKGFTDEKSKPLKFSAAGWREYILQQISKPDLAPTDAAREAKAKQLRALLEQIVKTDSMHDKLVKTKEPERFNEKSAFYNVIGDRPASEIAQMARVFDTKEDAKEIDAIADALRGVHEQTKRLNREGNYWSAPVQNVVNFYGYKNYVPFKGKRGRRVMDEELGFESRHLGGELQESQDTFEGRVSESENPILQSLAEGASAAMRAGRKELTLSIKNAIKDKILDGKVIGTINFQDRYLKGKFKEEFGGRNRIFHYNKDGTIDVLEITNPQQLEAIRRSYRTSSPILDKANTITSAVGQTHTRYNPSFAPMNFVRDSFTNAGVVGAELGPAAAGRFIKAVAADTADNGPARTLRFAYLYAKGNFSEINRLAGGTAPYEALNETQRYYRDISDYVKLGGRVSYLQGIAAKGALDELMKQAGRTGILKTKDQTDKFFDIYNDMFELAARVGSYRVMKSEYHARGNDIETAKVRAATFAKNLANFEQVGEWGKAAGAFYMFFRPAATGAVRAIDALKPAFGFNEKDLRAEEKQKGRTDEQIDRAVKKMREESKNARWMTTGLLGSGFAMYWMAYMLAGDDDEGRNRIAMDDMSRWTRYARFFIPGFEQPLQIPWGFGPGAFAAAGAQLAALTVGGSKTTFSDAMANVGLIGLESFLPIPFSRISPIENFPAFAIDSATPSVARPFFEYVMNLDGLGREIYNNRQTRYGDAYTGGDNIPEMYKKAARTLFDATGGAVDWSPNTLYFFANSFADGYAKIFSNAYNLGLSVMGSKDFDPKNDLFVLSSFIGTKSNVDAREFSKAEDYIKSLDKRLSALQDKPELLRKFEKDNPDAADLVWYYNKSVNGNLRKLRQEANEVRADSDYTPRERKVRIDQIVSEQNAIKRRLLEDMKMYGYKP